jgi:hypothetical protein
MITLYPHIDRKLAYDPVRDLAPVTSICSFPLVLVAGPAVPPEVKSAGDLVRWLRANPRQASYGTSAAGSTQHFIGAIFARAADVELTHVGYKGGGRAMPTCSAASCHDDRRRRGHGQSPGASCALPSPASSGRRCYEVRPSASGYAGLEAKNWFGVYCCRSARRDRREAERGVREAIRSKEMAEALTKIAVEPGGDRPRSARA